MDTFDSILEQLRRSQGRGLESIKNRLEFAIENLSEVLTDASNSIREAIPADAEEVIPIVDLEHSLSEMRTSLEAADAERESLNARIRTLTEQLEEGSTATGAVSFDLLRRLDGAGSQSELLRELLPVLCESVDRAAVLVIREGQVSAWSGIGFGDGERLRDWKAAIAESPSLSTLVEHHRTVMFMPDDDPVIAGWLEGETAPSHAMIAPVFLRGRLMGGIYTDDIGTGRWDADTARAMVALACWMIDTLHARQGGGTPVLGEPMTIDHGAPADEAAAIDTEADTDVATEESASQMEPAPTDVEEPVIEPPADDDQSPSFDPSATMRVEVTPEMLGDAAAEVAAETAEPEPAVEIVEPEIPPEPESEPEASPEPEPEISSEPVVPPPTTAPVEPPESQQSFQPPEPQDAAPAEAAPLSAEDEAKHDEARRFARLLVSEIKLYNETEVEQGRANGDLYERLKEDIDRSREMYEKRIDEAVRAAHDYFEDEMVRILADGDASALGM
jgi:molybdopterin converting factor small subunit